MPTANRRRFVPLAIQYFLRQDYPDKELLVVDDGEDAIGDLIPSDERIRYIRLQKKMTVGAKRNLASEQARGEIIAHWDDDDWHAPHRLRYQAEALLRSSAEVCGINTLLFYDINEQCAWQYRYPANQKFWLSGSSLCYKRSFWKKHRFAELNVGEDGRFVWSGRPEQMVLLPDCTFHVGLIHAHNVSPKHTRGAYWQRCPVEDIQKLMGSDWDFYRTTFGDSAARSCTADPVGRQQKKRANTMNDIAVIVTCHEPHLKWLRQTLASIDRQTPLPAERVVAFDRCKPPVGLDQGWRAIEGDWGHPAEGRNAGLAATTAPWLIFWDADNVMPEGYITAMQRAIGGATNDLAILYPDIQYCDENLRPQRLWQTPVWDYWGMRAQNCVDTSSAWRREALEIVEGWSNRTGGSMEDYALALDITAAGWKAAKVDGPAVFMRVLAEGRMQRRLAEGGALNDVWKARSLTIVSLLAGREEVFPRWADFLLNADLPPKTSLHVIDNSGHPEFTQMAFDTCQRIASLRALSHLHFAASGQPYQLRESEPYFIKNRHLHVARLYASILPRLSEDLVMTLEDDVEPPHDAVRKLGEEIGWTSHGNIGAVAAAYAMPQNESWVCAGRGTEEWGAAIDWRQLPREPIDVGCVGGGCTIWANWALHGLPVNFWWQRGLGWDAALCMQMRRRGYRIRLHGGVRCQHHLHGRVNGKADFWMVKPANMAQNEIKTMQIHQNADSWIPPAELGTRIPPYKPTFDFASYINERHRSFSTCTVKNGIIIDIGIPGWLRREDALKLYELAYSVSGDILELGCYQGLSTSILAQAIKDSGDQKLIVSVDKEANALASAEKHLTARGLGRYIKFIRGDGAYVCQRLIRESRRFSFIFIDHSHQYQDMVEVCQLLAQLLTRGGFCLFHDFNDGRNNDPKNAEYKVTQAVHDSLNMDVFEFYGIFGCTALYRYSA